MNKEIIDILVNLKQSPSKENVDHILLLEKIYSAYKNGIHELKPIVDFYLNSFDELPTLKEKPLWNARRFNQIRKDFVNDHSILLKLIDNVLNEKILGNLGDVMSKEDFLEQVKLGRVYFENIELDKIDVRNENLSGLTFKSCYLSVNFRNCNLSFTKFIESNIKTCDFRDANLSFALMKNVSFEGTKFRGAQTNGFIFIDNDCFSVKGIGQSDFEEWIFDTD